MSSDMAHEFGLPGYGIDATPARVLDYPGMTAKSEKALLYWLAKNWYRGEGIIVDAGLFLGASTNAFAEGIKANATALGRLAGQYRPIHSYDIAIWVRSMDKYLERPAIKKALRGQTVKRGESFERILRSLLAAHTDLIDFRFGDIAKTARADRMIEIAFFDCLKNGALDKATFMAFGPHYVPGKTIVVQQDYFFEGAADNKVRQEFLSPYFTYLGSAATSAVFRLDRPLPDEFFRNDPVDALSLPERRGLLQRAAERATEPRFRLFVELAEVEMLAEHAGREAALAQLDQVDRHIADLGIDLIGDRPATQSAALRSRLQPSTSPT